MDVSVFHQNTKNLSPSDPSFTYYKTAFRSIRQTTGKYYVAAGLTELLGDPKSLADNVPKLAQNLDPRLDKAVVVAIGQLSSPQRLEYIGIAYDSSFFTLESAGSVLRLSGSGDWFCNNKPAATMSRTRNGNGYIGMPSASVGYKLDYRSLAYVVGLVNNVDRYVFGFMHNDFGNGDRSGSFRGLGFAAEKILGAANVDPDNAFIVFGGDFNVAPDDVAGRKVTLKAHYAVHNEKAIKTTAANPYDFWLLSPNVDVQGALVYSGTRNVILSDHSGIAVDFDY